MQPATQPRKNILIIVASIVATIVIAGAIVWLLSAMNIKETSVKSIDEPSKTESKDEADTSFHKAQQLLREGKTAAAKSEFQNAKKLYQKFDNTSGVIDADTAISLIETSSRTKPTQPSSAPAAESQAAAAN